MAKEIKFGVEARKALESGVNQLPDTVGLIIIEHFHRLADKPFISFVVDFPVIEFHDLFLVDGEHEVGRPLEIFRIDIDRI